MSSWCQRLYIRLVILLSLINAQSEERFYEFKFDGQSDWTIVDIGQGISTSSSSYCPSGGTCWDLEGEAIASRVISTEGYHSIRIVIDVTESLGHDDECLLHYKSDSVNWINVTVADRFVGTNRNVEITPADNSDYNNRASFEIRLSNTGADLGDSCYFDGLEVFGMPYTEDPTPSPTPSPTPNPTHTPSMYPTFAPSITPTPAPTRTPTPNPTNNPSTPTLIPTDYPSPEPTIDPSIHPTIDPTHVPTFAPTHIPTPSPMLYIPIYPTPSPTLLPTLPSSDNDVHHHGDDDKRSMGEVSIVLSVELIIGLCASICLLCIVSAMYFGYRRRQKRVFNQESMDNIVVQHSHTNHISSASEVEAVQTIEMSDIAPAQCLVDIKVSIVTQGNIIAGHDEISRFSDSVSDIDAEGATLNNNGTGETFDKIKRDEFVVGGDEEDGDGDTDIDTDVDLNDILSHTLDGEVTEMQPNENENDIL